MEHNPHYAKADETSENIGESNSGLKIEVEFHPENINAKGDLEHNQHYAVADETTENIEDFASKLKIDFQFHSEDLNANGDLKHNPYYAEANEIKEHIGVSTCGLTHWRNCFCLKIELEFLL